MKPTYPDLSQKVVLVTGAARGIGRAIALAFAGQGAQLIIDDLPNQADELTLLESTLRAQGVVVTKVVADVRDADAVQALIKTSIAEYKKIDVLVNNAGIVFDKEWTEKTVTEWHDTLDTNLIAPYLLAKAATPYLRESHGVIVNIASTNAYKAMNPFSLDYDASKAGQITLTHNLAAVLAPDVRVVGVAPGWVDTDMNKDLPKKIIETETNKIFLRRFAGPEEIADVVVFLASLQARYITGTTVTVDGGY